MGKMKSISTLAICCSLLGASALHAQFSLSEAEGYNLVTFGDFSGAFSDVEGGVAAEGNATLTGYSVNSADTTLPGNAALVVGGDLNYQGGEVSSGDVYVGGTVINAPGTPGGSVYNTSGPYDFTAAESALSAKSTAYSAYGDSGTSYTYQHNGLVINSSSAASNVVNLDMSVIDFASLTSMQVNGTAGSQLLINIFGTSSTDFLEFSNMGMNVFDYSSVLFNLVDVENLYLTGIGFGGSVLGTETDVEFTNGQFNGQLISKSLNGNGELHAHFFTGLESVPEPSTYGIIGAMLLLGLIARRRFGK